MRGLLAAALFVISGFALATPGAEHAQIERTAGKDRFVTGSSVTIDRPALGDLVLGGGDLEVAAPVAGDLVAAGGMIRLDADTAQDVYAVGARVLINAAIGRNARVAGGHVTVEPRARIAGGASLAGGELRVLGTVGGYLQAAGGRVYIDGRVGGDVDVAADEIELGPHARVDGTLRYVSRETLRLDPGAQVKGGIERRLAPLPRPPARQLAHALALVWIAGLMLLTAVLVAVMPGFFGAVGATLRRRFWWSLLLGFGLLVSVPAAALLLVVTVIGAPLALLLVALYGALVLAGYVSAGIALGEGLLRRWKAARAEATGWRVAAAVLGVLTVALVARIPLLGALLGFIALIAGMGALALQVRRGERMAGA